MGRAAGGEFWSQETANAKAADSARASAFGEPEGAG